MTLWIGFWKYLLPISNFNLWHTMILHVLSGVHNRTDVREEEEEELFARFLSLLLLHSGSWGIEVYPSAWRLNPAQVASLLHGHM